MIKITLQLDIETEEGEEWRILNKDYCKRYNIPTYGYLVSSTGRIYSIMRNKLLGKVSEREKVYIYKNTGRTTQHESAKLYRATFPPNDVILSDDEKELEKKCRQIHRLWEKHADPLILEKKFGIPAHIIDTALGPYYDRFRNRCINNNCNFVKSIRLMCALKGLDTTDKFNYISEVKRICAEINVTFSVKLYDKIYRYLKGITTYLILSNEECSTTSRKT